MGCVIMEVAHKCHVSPYRVFLQACVGIDPIHAEEMAKSLHHDWLVDDLISPAVEDFCLNIVKRKRYHK